MHRSVKALCSGLRTTTTNPQYNFFSIVVPNLRSETRCTYHILRSCGYSKTNQCYLTIHMILGWRDCIELVCCEGSHRCGLRATKCRCRCEHQRLGTAIIDSLFTDVYLVNLITFCVLLQAGNTPLMIAAQAGHTDTVRALLHHQDIHVNATNSVRTVCFSYPLISSLMTNL